MIGRIPKQGKIVTDFDKTEEKIKKDIGKRKRKEREKNEDSRSKLEEIDP